MLKKKKDMDALRVAASNVRSYVYKKFLEWEGGPNRGDRAKGRIITGLAKRIMTYLNMIKNAQCLPEKTKDEIVNLIGLDKLVKLESNITGQGI